MGKRAVALALAAVGISACNKGKEADPPEPAPQAAAPTPAEPKHAASTAIAWIEDDYEAAAKRAGAAKLPMVVDLWAAWCHTCLSMKQTVLADPGLADLADRFVWVAIDTEKPTNQDVVAKLPLDVWPTFYVVSPEGGAIQARQIGATSVTGFRDFVLRGERGHLATLDASGALSPGSPLAELRAAERALVAGDAAAADAAYARALAAAPADWERTSEVLLAQLLARAKAGDTAGCAELGAARLDEVAAHHGPQVADFAYVASDCAANAEGSDAAAMRRRATAAIEAVLADDAAPLSIDDRSEGLRMLRELAELSGDAASARGYAVRQKKLLDDAVASASSAYQAMTYGYHRAEVYVSLGLGAELVPWLEELTAKLPTEYDPPYRLATLLAGLGRNDAAAAAARLAVERAPDGPRKAWIYEVLADIEDERGEVEAELAARQKVVELYAALPADRKSDGADERARAALAAAGEKARAAR